jgi:hypothetical protein
MNVFPHIYSYRDGSAPRKAPGEQFRVVEWQKQLPGRWPRRARLVN